MVTERDTVSKIKTSLMDRGKSQGTGYMSRTNEFPKTVETDVTYQVPSCALDSVRSPSVGVQKTSFVKPKDLSYRLLDLDDWDGVPLFGWTLTSVKPPSP